MAAATDAEMKGRLRNPQLGEELIRHRRIEVLSGVQDPLSDWPIAGDRGLNGPADGRGLDELWPGPDDGEQLHQARTIRAAGAKRPRVSISSRLWAAISS